MPGAPGNSSPIVAQPPSRFRVPSSKDQAAPDSEPTGARPVLIGLPPPRPASSRSSQRSFACREPSPANSQQAAPASPSGSDTPKSSAHKRSCLADNVAIKDYEPLGRSASLPVIGHGAPSTVGVQQQVSVTELVNLAAKAAEIEEKHFFSRRGYDPRPGLASKDIRNTYSRLYRQSSAPSHHDHKKDSSNTSSPRHRQPLLQSNTHSSSGSSSSRRLHTVPQLASGDSSGDSSTSRRPNSISASTAKMTCGADGVEQLRSSSSCGVPPACHTRDSLTSRGSSSKTATAFSDAGYQQQALLEQQQQQPQQQFTGSASVARQPTHCRFPSDSGSDDSAINTAAASISSSASCSSLCSAASYGSNASTCTTGSRPKSILLNRSSSGSLGSSASSPRCIKRVSWKDGQAGCELEVGGNALVAVKYLEDSTEIRRLRRNTWPENQSARREALEAAAKEQQQRQQQQQQSSLARAIELLQEPAKLFDWRDKLKELQQERWQQRLGIVQAAWQAQQQQLATAAEDVQEGQVEDMDISDLAPGKDNSSAIVAPQKQQEQAVTSDASCIPAAAAAAAVSCSKLGGPAGGTIQLEAVAAISAGSF